MTQPEAVRQIGQLLNNGGRHGRSTRLAKLMGTGATTVQSWAAAGDSESRKRTMSPTARRLMFLLLALHEDGADLDRLRRRARDLEGEYLGEDND